MKGKLLVLITLIAGASLFSYAWWAQAVKPADPTNTEPVIFTIAKGEGVRTISDRLYKENLIRSPIAFFLLSRFGGYDEKIQAGDFRLSPTMDMHSIAENLTHGSIDTWVTIPEGWRNEEIALKLAKELAIPEREFVKVSREGYMFPDTYLFPKDASAAAVVAIFRSTFDKKITDAIKQEAAAKNIPMDDVITIASLVEREAKFKEDRPIVASVILNRLAINMKLDLDATVQYAIGYDAQEKTWWKKNLTIDDLGIDSPYNTYKVTGLPPSAISNPGIDAIKAVLEAPQTEYLYYVSDSAGKIHPATTFEEHSENISKYIER